jgi:hypothetical protein
MDGYLAEIEARMVGFFESLGERDRRRYAALEALKLGHGGIAYISQLFGCDPKTIQQGKSEIDHPPTAEELKRQRKKTAAARRRKLLRLKSS